MGKKDKSRFTATFRLTVPNFSELRETALSPPTFVRHLSWKIMVRPETKYGKGRHPTRSLGLFVQCNGHSKFATWACNAVAYLRLISQKDGVKNLSRMIKHRFHSDDNNSGISDFMAWDEVLDPERGFIKDDTIIVEVSVSVGVVFKDNFEVKNHRRHTGFIGLKNQGATCYMNSLLQALFFTNKLRKAVYQIPTESEDSTSSVALALQRLFYELQFSDKPVETKKLTKSFGWEDSSTQHDVQEFCRVLLDCMESKMKGTNVEGTIPRLFEGKMTSFLLCEHVNYTSSRIESFYDIQLNVKEKKNITESFKNYCATEILDGENKYDAGVYGLQDAKKGIFFSSLPPVLHLHLLRFQYDAVADENIKINDRFEFPEKLHLEEFLKSEEDVPPPVYTLHAVLVHIGDDRRGHYVVFINPKGDGEWCKFNDDYVSRCSREEAVDHNFGGHVDDSTTVKPYTSAYMLVYIKDSEIADVLQPVTEQDIPGQLVERLKEEERQEALRRQERNDAHLYMKVQTVSSDNFCGHQGPDLYDPEKVNYTCFKVKKSATLGDFMKLLSEQMKYPIDMIRPWPVICRKNQTRRPVAIDLESDYNKTIREIADNSILWTVFLEIAGPDSGMQCLPEFNNKCDVLLFFKLYDPKYKLISYCGHTYMPINATARALIPILNERAGFPEYTELMLFKEVKPYVVERIENLDLPLENIIDELMDGDIIVFQRAGINFSDCELPTVKEYFHDLSHRVEVTFCDKSIPTDRGFTMVLSQKMDYDQMSHAVAQKLNINPYLLQFFKALSNRGGPGAALKRSYEGTLKELFVANKPRQPKKLHYQQLYVQLWELENKKQLRCTWVNSKLKEVKELVLYPSKNGCVGDLLEEAKKHVELSENGSGKLRLLEIICNKIFSVPRNDVSLDLLSNAGSRSLRIEEIPVEDVEIDDDEYLIPVAHFHKQVFATFGVPFLLKIKHQEPFSNVKERIKKKLEVPENEFARYIFTIVTRGRQLRIEEDSNYRISLPDFLPPPRSGGAVQPRPWLGLKHTNKAQILDRAIKIHN